MPINKVIILEPGLIGRFFPIISTSHLHLCKEKVNVVNIPKENNIIPSIIQRKTFEKNLDLRTIFDRDYKSLVKIYNSIRHKYYPEKDVYRG